MSSIEWGIRQRHLPTGTIQEYYLEDQEEAAGECSAMADLNPERWEITFGYRTRAVEAGPFTEYTVPVPRRHTDDEVTPEALAGMISLAAGVMIPAEVIATWTPADREDAAAWASGEHLIASDNPGIKRVPQPEMVARAVAIVQNPAMAQLAVEGWLRAKADVEGGGFTSWDIAADTLTRAGQDAITGLLVLLRERQPS